MTTSGAGRGTESSGPHYGVAVFCIVWLGLGILFAVLFWSFPIRWFAELMVAAITVGGWIGAAQYVLNRRP